MLTVNSRNNRKIGKIYLELTIKTLGQHHGRRSFVFIVNFEHILHILLVSLNVCCREWVVYLFTNINKKW